MDGGGGLQSLMWILLQNIKVTLINITFIFFVMINFFFFDFSSLNHGKVKVGKLNHCSGRINFLHEKVDLEVCVNGSNRAQTIIIKKAGIFRTL